MATTSNTQRGRPSDFTDEIGATICSRLAGGETLRAICRDEDMPAASTVIGWSHANEAFSEQYAKSRKIGYEHMADELLEIADDGTGDVRVDEEGHESTNHDVIARSRLRVDTRKWLLSKALPKLYGDKLETTTKLVDENDIPVTPIELARRIAFAFAQSGATPGQSAPPTGHPAQPPTKQPKQP